MTAVLIFVALALFLVLALFWFSRRVYAPRGTPPPSGKIAIEELFPLHSRHFPQILQTLASSDEDYLRIRVSAQLHRRVRAERRAVVHSFLAGLRDDFRRLHQLAQTISALSPQIESGREMKRLWLRLEFESLCWAVRIRLMTGWDSAPLLKDLTGIVGAQAAQIEAAMARLELASLARVRESFSA